MSNNVPDEVPRLNRISGRLTLPPSVNSCYIWYKGIKRLSKQARTWQSSNILLLKNKKQAATGYKMIETRAGINQTFYFCDNKRRDSSNYVKMLHDALVYAGLLQDDSLLFEEHSKKVIDKNLPFNTVYFELYELMD